MRTVGRVLVSGLVLTAGALGFARAADHRVTATVEPRGTVGDTETVRLVIEVQGEVMPEVSVPRFPALKNLRIIRGPSTSRSQEFGFSGTQRRASATTTLTYTLLPEGPGAAEVPPIDVRVGEQTYRTNAIALRVERGATGPQGTPQPGTAGDGIDLFLRAEIEKPAVFLNEPVLLTVTLYAGTQIAGFSWATDPDLSAFWVEDQPLDSMAERYRTTIGGRRYIAYPVLRKVLVPTSAGEKTVDPLAAQIVVPRPSRDLFDGFFSRNRGQTVIRRTEPIRLEVRPLPAESRPEGFSGAVGTFALSAKIDRSEVEVNDAVALSVTVEGAGTLRSIAAPEIAANRDLKVFSPEVRDSTELTDGTLRSKRTWEWVIVPLVPGEIAVPPVEFPYFDTKQGAYRLLRSEATTLTVRRGEGPTDTAIARNFVRPQRREIAFIKSRRGMLAEEKTSIEKRPVFIVLAVLPFLLTPIVIVLGRRRVRLQSNRGLVRSRRARTRARKKLKSAQHRVGRLDSGTFHEEVSRALVEYVADRFDRSAAGMTYDLAEDLLASRGVDREVGKRFRSCLETCDFARFVPDSGQSGRRAEILQEARGVIDAVERAL